MPVRTAISYVDALLNLLQYQPLRTQFVPTQAKRVEDRLLAIKLVLQSLPLSASGCAVSVEGFSSSAVAVAAERLASGSMPAPPPRPMLQQQQQALLLQQPPQQHLPTAAAPSAPPAGAHPLMSTTTPGPPAWPAAASGPLSPSSLQSQLGPPASGSNLQGQQLSFGGGQPLGSNSRELSTVSTQQLMGYFQGQLQPAGGAQPQLNSQELGAMREVMSLMRRQVVQEAGSDRYEVGGGRVE